MRLFKIVCLLIGLVGILFVGRWLYKHYIDLRVSNAFLKTRTICHEINSKDATVDSIREWARIFDLQVNEEIEKPQEKNTQSLKRRIFVIRDSFLGSDSTSCTITFAQGKLIELRSSRPDF